MARRLVLASVLTLVGLSAGLIFACVPDEQEQSFRFDVTPRPDAWIPAPLPQAHCEILVEGKGVKQMETDYLPHVITCENGGANLEALKAQAIAARSVAYYYIENQGSVCDSQGCQVYGCGAEPSAMAIQAVNETSGMYMNFNNVLTYAFYVAGDPNTPPPACVGNVNVGTEHWVTYNENQTGANVDQTALGWIFQPNENGYGQNRGCMSQWGARCLENNNGYDYLGILNFYYGDDIVITQAQGPCVMQVGDGDGDSGGDGDGDGDGDPTTTSATDSGDSWGSGDGDGEPGDGDGDDACSVGSYGCVCTMGGGCDPGLTCIDGYCVPTGPSEGGEDDTATDGETGQSGGWQDDAFDGGENGCGCATDRSRPGVGVTALAVLALLGLRRRRDR